MTGEASPYVGRVLDAAFAEAQAVVALFTGDDEARLRPALLHEGEDPETPTPQPRPNVLLEAGMALGSHPDRTLFVHVGKLRPISDLEGRHVVSVQKGRPWRREIADRLRTAKCAVDTDHHRDWEKAGAALEDAGARITTPVAVSPTPPPQPMHDPQEQALLFNAHIQERLEKNGGNTITLNLREDRSATPWAGLTEQQLAGELQRMEKDRKIVIVDGAGFVFRIQAPATTVSESSVITSPRRGW